MFQRNLETFRTKMAEAGVDVALITDDDSVYYLTGYYDYLHMEFGRPTILIIPRDGPSVLITPIIDYVAAQSAAQVDRIAPWNDGAGDEWRSCGQGLGCFVENDRQGSYPPGNSQGG